jgi:hypothetical protein
VGKASSRPVLPMGTAHDDCDREKIAHAHTTYSRGRRQIPPKHGTDYERMAAPAPGFTIRLFFGRWRPHNRNRQEQERELPRPRKKRKLVYGFSSEPGTKGEAVQRAILAKPRDWRDAERHGHREREEHEQFATLFLGHGQPRGKCKFCAATANIEAGRDPHACPHGRVRSLCKECGGGSICAHGRVRSLCKECGGGSICAHGRVRSRCKECGGANRALKLSIIESVSRVLIDISFGIHGQPQTSQSSARMCRRQLI